MSRIDSGPDLREEVCAQEPIRVGKFQYPHDARWWSFRCRGLRLLPCDTVIVRCVGGEEAIGTVRTHAGPLPLDPRRMRSLAEVLRHAGHEEIEQRALHARLEMHAFRFCSGKIAERGLAMRLLFVERPWQQKKLIFHFRAPHRVDFRELVKDLKHVYDQRILLRWERERDYAKLVGGGAPDLWTPARHLAQRRTGKKGGRQKGANCAAH